MPILVPNWKWVLTLTLDKYYTNYYWITSLLDRGSILNIYTRIPENTGILE